MSGALPALQALLGSRISVDASDLHHWGRDWTRTMAPAPLAVAWPQSTAEVSEILKLCSQHRLAVVPSGGRTGLAGGAVAAHGELVLSLDRMRQVGPVDAAGRTVRVQAGLPNQLLQDHCRAHGLWWPVDLAAKGSATIGGNLATNAGGLRVVRYGHARNWVLGVQAVTMAGDVLQLGGALIKDNSGYALQQLLVGSEGTLAVITDATLLLAPLPGPTTVLMLACQRMEDVLGLLEAVRQEAVVLDAFEVFSSFCAQRVAAHTGQRRPVATDTPWYALVEFENPTGQDVDLLLQRWLQAGLVADGVAATDHAQATRLWAWRERITESLQADTPHKNDVAVPVAALPAFVEALQAWLARALPDQQVAVFGHVGDGNLHVNTLKPQGMSASEFAARSHLADRGLFEQVARLGGSISAEHGIGLVKKPWLSLTRGSGERAAMVAIKAALDPQGLLNPGKIFDAATQ